VEGIAPFECQEYRNQDSAFLALLEARSFLKESTTLRDC
jgi:hypothetical protein